MNTEANLVRTPLHSSSPEDSAFVGPRALTSAQTRSDKCEAISGASHLVTRSLLQALTLPPIPRLDIPPSPSGTVSSEVLKKFRHFCTLKKNNVHFNEKLARSSALRNPSLVKRLMEFADIEGKDYYETTLPTDIWCSSKVSRFYKRNNGK
jgi:hypothetical protein